MLLRWSKVLSYWPSLYKRCATYEQDFMITGTTRWFLQYHFDPRRLSFARPSRGASTICRFGWLFSEMCHIHKDGEADKFTLWYLRIHSKRVFLYTIIWTSNLLGFSCPLYIAPTKVCIFTLRFNRLLYICTSSIEKLRQLKSYAQNVTKVWFMNITHYKIPE